MPTYLHSAILKQEIEAQLALRIPAALSPQSQQAPRLIQSGVPEIDRLLGGGLPIGGISEFTGVSSSGRTSLALSLLARCSVESTCAYVDADDSLDPRSAAAAGVHLHNFLWVRIDAAAKHLEAAKNKINSSTRLPISPTRLAGRGHDGHHPRTETRGIDSAVGKMIAQKAEARLEKMEGTPGYPNRKLSLASASEEQISYEHYNARRADESDPIRKADQRAAVEARQRSRSSITTTPSFQKQQKPWSKLHKAIRASDQILQSGGFRVVVLDLASVPAKQVLRIPSATWFRFRRAAQESDAVFLLLTQVACARSSALCVLDCSAGAATSKNVLSGVARSAEVARQRLSGPFAKKAPGRAVIWEATPSWMRAAGR